MRVYEKQTKTREWEADVLVKLTCDICGKEADPMVEWAPGVYNDDETVVRYRVGNSYPTGGSYIEYTFDICPGCFLNKLIPWFESFGATVRESEVDW